MPLAALSLSGLLGACQEKPKLQEPSTATSPAAAATDQAPSKGQDAKAPVERSEFSFASTKHTLTLAPDQKPEFQIVPGKGLKINPDYPWKVTLTPPAQGLTLAKDALKKEDLRVDEQQAIVPISISTLEPGEHALQATVNLSVCETGGQKRCLWFTDEPVTIAIHASP